MPHAPQFDGAFRAKFEDLLLWRRDVRHFKRDPVDRAMIDHLLQLACLAPSVGNSQPWRFVVVDHSARRAAIRANFIACNSEALHSYKGERAELYAKLKLAGLDEAPVHIAVFADTATEAGHGLGSRTMPETLCYSVVSAMQTFWLAARAHGVGVGWLSILDPETVSAALDVPDDWTFVAYLCVGYAEEETPVPELVREGWQDRLEPDAVILER